jgi:multidrug efflux system membrane fusion protein
MADTDSDPPAQPAKNQRKSWLRAAALGVIGLLVLAAVVVNRSRPAPVVAEPPPAVPVTIGTAEKKDVPLYLTAPGTVTPNASVKITSRVDGTIQQIAFTEGQDVRKGQLLALVDPRPYQAALDAAKAKLQQDQAGLANAQLILSRYATLQKSGFSTEENLDTQKTLVAQYQAGITGDEAAISAAETSLSYTRIEAPIDGRTGLRLVDEGNVVRGADATAIVVLTQLTPITIIAPMPEASRPALTAALARGAVVADAISKADGSVIAAGKLTVIDNAIDPASGTLKVRALFDNGDLALWPGQFLDLRVTIDVARGATTVPSSAIQRGEGGLFVYRVGPDNRVTAQSVRTGSIGGGVAVITSGLAPGDRVVTSGQFRLAPGVGVVDASAAAGSQQPAAPLGPVQTTGTGEG